MIGIIIFYLVCVHLGVGMLATMIPISQRTLGERFFRFNATVSLVLLGLAQVGYHLYAPGDAGSSAEVAGVWRSLVDRAVPWIWACAGLLLLYLILLPFRHYLLSRSLLAGCAGTGAGALVVMALGTKSKVIPENLGAFLFSADSMLSSLLLGSVVICMVLGHWYLVDPSMSVRHLKGVAALFIGAVVARVLLGGCTSILMWHDARAAGADLLSNGILIHLLFLSQRVLFGLVLPLALSWMIWQTVKIRSTQSATGILYVAVVFILFGEFLSRYILVTTGYPI